MSKPPPSPNLRLAEMLLTIQQMVEALDFYANPLTYFGIAVVADHPAGPFNQDSGPLTDAERDIYEDYRKGSLAGATYHGQKARDALEAWRSVIESKREEPGG